MDTAETGDYNMKTRASVELLLIFTILTTIFTPVISPLQGHAKGETKLGLNVNTNQFKVEIVNIGPSSQSPEIFHPINDNVYHIVSRSAITIINFDSSFSGYSQWELGNHTLTGISYPQILGNSTIIGQYYLILDGFIRTVQMDEVGPASFNVGIPQGDHTLSLLYITKLQNGELEMASDTVIIRIRKENDQFQDYIKETKSVTLSYNDVHESSHSILQSEVISMTNTSSDFSLLYGFKREFTWKPSIEINFTQAEREITENSNIVKQDAEIENFKLDVNVNSTGFDELQIYNQWNKSKGFSFVIDASGPHLLTAENYSSGSVTVDIRHGNNYVGILTLAPFGIWHAENSLAYPDVLECRPGITCKYWQIADHELAIGFPVGSYPNRTLITSTGEAITIDGSFDFTANLVGRNFQYGFQDRTEATISDTSETILLIPFGLIIVLMVVRSWRRFVERL